MSPANSNTPIHCQPVYGGEVFWLGIHKVQIGDVVVARFGSKQEAEVAMRERGTVRTKWGKA